MFQKTITKIRSILRALSLVIMAILYRVITFFVPKKTNRWIFGCWKGRNYSDNSRALFEYVQRVHPEIEAAWVAKNDNVLDAVKKLGFRAIDYRTIRGKLFVMRAYICVQTEGNGDTGTFKISGAKVIQLWHGIGDAKTTFNRMNPLKKWLVEIYSDTHRKSIWMTSSDHQKEIFHEYFHVPFERIFVTGTPRTDAIIECKKHNFFETIKLKNKKMKFIAYMPTHRKFGKNQYNILESSELNNVNDFLIKNDMFLFIKPHPLEVYKYKDANTKFSNIFILLGEKFNDTHSYLHYFDALISDYSSISYDFLCFNKPIILFTYDYQEFANTDMGLRDDYKSLSPGPLCSTWSDVCSELYNAFVDDSYRKKRESLIPRYYKYLDTCNSERVYEQILNVCM